VSRSRAGRAHPRQENPQSFCGNPRTGDAAQRANLQRMPASATTKLTPLLTAGAWTVDQAHSTVGFEVRHLKVSRVKGRFRSAEADISSDTSGVTRIEGRVQVASIDTGEHKRDANLRGGDFFDSERHPEITFSGTCEPALREQGLRVRGTLTIRGVSRPLELAIERARVPGGDGVRLRAEGAVSRREYGLLWDAAVEAGGLVVEDRVRLALDVTLRRTHS